MSPWSYSTFGLRLRADEPIHGLVAAPSEGPADVEVWSRDEGTLGPALRGPQLLWYESPIRDEHGRPVLTVWHAAGGHYFRLCYPDGAEFVLDRAGRRVWARGLAGLPAEEKRLYLLGPVLTFVLRLRGVLCLHASAVGVAGRAVVFLGPEGAGKSTVAAALAARGWPVLSDDVVALVRRGGQTLAQPGYPRLCLRPSGLAALAGAGLPCPHGSPFPDGRLVDLDLTRNGYRFQRDPLPLAAGYVLDDGPAAPDSVRLSGPERLLALTANAWLTKAQDGAMRAEQFAQLGRLAAALPLSRVGRLDGPGGLGRLCDRMREDLERRAAAFAGLPADS